MKDYDVVVIGSGPGGYIAAIRAAQLGLKTACVEKETSLGGTCLNVGCIPSKTLLTSTEHYAWIRSESAKQGILCSEVSVDFSQLMKRKAQVVAGLTQGIESLFKQHGVTSIQGAARFESPTIIEVGSQKIEASHFILATGSEPISLPFMPFDEKRVLSSTGALALDHIPKKMIVIGGGAIGLELASVYNRLGTSVVVVEMLDRICANMDDAVSKTLLQTLKKQGMQFLLGAKVTKSVVGASEITLSVEKEGKEEELQADIALVAVGRRPYSQGLGLEKLGIQMNKGLVVVDSHFRTSLPHIYAIGDLVDGPMLAHKASEEGYAVADLIAGHAAQVNYMAIPNVIYTHPEVASVGMTEQEARAIDWEVSIGTSSFRANPRARCNDYTEGFVKVIGAGKNKQMVGMHIVGPQASELIQIGMIAIQKKATLAEMAHSAFAHPTLSEAIKEACQAAL